MPYAKTTATCSADDCDKQARNLGLCSGHYEALRVARAKPCSIVDCHRHAASRGLCGTHYQRWRNHGTATPTARTQSERFWAMVTEVDDCWIFRNLKPNGYGIFDKGSAHRFAYTEMVAEIPEGLDLDHLCRVRACVNPYHLEPVTRRVNLLRGAASRRLEMEKQ